MFRRTEWLVSVNDDAGRAWLFVVSPCRLDVTGTMTSCRHEKSTCGQGGGIGNRKPMSATDSSDAPARSSDARREAWGGAATGSAWIEGPGGYRRPLDAGRDGDAEE